MKIPKKIDLAVIVTNYNKAHSELLSCMDSLKKQTVKPKEIVLVDDCSDDPRAHALARSIILPENVGVSRAREIGVANTTAQLLLFVDADDLLPPDYIERMAQKIAKADIVYPDLILFQGNNHSLHVAPSSITPARILSNKCEIPVTSLMKREVYTSLGGFRDLPVFEDWDFWIRAMCNGYTFTKAQTSLLYRQTSGSRVHQNQELKNKVHTQITAPYHIQKGKLCLKK